MAEDETLPLASAAFQKYPKMAETSGTVGASAGLGRYIVTEKVHGANFCLISQWDADGPQDVRFAKRTGMIGDQWDGEDFYSCRSTGLLRELAPKAKGILSHLSPTVCAVHIYGELFGGSYPHPEVEAVPGLQPVQCGVWYCPDIRFIAFDVAVELRAAEGGPGRRFLDFDKARSVCESHGLLFAKPLLVGSLSECVDFCEVFETTIPARLGLPQILDAGGGNPNHAEGVVVRPVREPLGCVTDRGLFKRKAAAFSEKRYQNNGWREAKAGGAGLAPQATALDLTRVEVLACVLPARLHAVQSKVGRVDVRDRPAVQRLLQLFMDDVREALEDEDREVLDASEELQRELLDQCKDCMRGELLPTKSKA